MTLTEKTKVIYKEKSGVVVFTCPEYIVICWDTFKGQRSPRLIVYPHQYKNVTIYKASEK